MSLACTLPDYQSLILGYREYSVVTLFQYPLFFSGKHLYSFVNRLLTVVEIWRGSSTRKRLLSAGCGRPEECRRVDARPNPRLYTRSPLVTHKTAVSFFRS